MFSLYNIYVLLYIQIKDLTQLVSVQGESAKDLGSIPRSQPLFLIFSIGNPVHSKSRSSPYTLRIWLPYSSTPQINMPSLENHHTPQSSVYMGLGKVKKARIFCWAQISNSTPQLLMQAHLLTFFIFIFFIFFFFKFPLFIFHKLI